MAEFSSGMVFSRILGGGVIVSRENMGGLVLYTGGWKSVYVDGGQIQGQFLKLTPLILRGFKRKQRKNGVFLIHTYWNLALSDIPETLTDIDRH